MPILSSTALNLSELESQMPTPSIVATQSIGIFVETINEASLEIAKTINRIYTEPWQQILRRIQSMIVTQNKIMIQSLTAELSFNKLFPEGIINFDTPTPFKAASIGIFGEINVVEGQVQEIIQGETIHLPATISKAQRSKMGLKYISGGNFSYKRKTLMGLSLGNREGRMLGTMLENPDLFVSDQVIDKKFFTSGTLGRSNLIKLLKNKFKLNKLEATIKRQGEGYIMINIRPIYIN